MGGRGVSADTRAPAAYLLEAHGVAHRSTIVAGRTDCHLDMTGAQPVSAAQIEAFLRDALCSRCFPAHLRGRP
jgi:hypothetical protein